MSDINKNFRALGVHLGLSLPVSDEELIDPLPTRETVSRYALARIRELEQQVEAQSEIVKAVAHIGIDFGYGPYKLEQRHIDTARALTTGDK